MADDMLNLEFLRRQLAQAKAAEDRDQAARRGNGGNGSGDGMSGERIGRLEGAVEGLKHSQNMLAAASRLVTAEDHDIGHIVAIDGDMAEVAWDSGVRTPCPIADLSIT